MSSPSNNPTPSTGGDLILWGSIDRASVDEDALNDWWTNEHLPERLQLPGFQLARRYRALDPKNGQNEYLALYEVWNVRDLASPEYLHALNHPTTRTVQFMPCLAKMNRFACIRTWEKPSAYSVVETRHEPNNYLFMVVCELGEEAAKSGRSYINQALDHLSLDEHPPSAEVMRSRLATVSPAITARGSTSKSYDGVGFNTSPDQAATNPDRSKTFIFLFDLYTHSTSTPTSLPSLLSSTWFITLSSILQTADLHILHTNIYSLIATLAKDAIDAAA